jgi:hypothetical protein
MEASIVHEGSQTLARALLLVALTLLTACDPGITIRQINSTVQAEKQPTVIPKLSVEVQTTHQLIGEGWYHPQIKIVNSSDFPMTITGIELIAGGVTYENSPHHAKNYPLTLAAQSSASLDVEFRFSQGVYKVFENPSELRIQYSSRGDSGFTRIALASGLP